MVPKASSNRSTKPRYLYQWTLSSVYRSAGLSRMDLRGSSGQVGGTKALLYAGFTANFSDQRTFAVICITINKVKIAPIVMASPVNPSKKNAYENRIR